MNTKNSLKPERVHHCRTAVVKIMDWIERGQKQSSGVSPSSFSSGIASAPAPTNGGGINMAAMLPELLKIGGNLFASHIAGRESGLEIIAAGFGIQV